MNKQKSKRYLFIRCNSEEVAHDFLVDWEYEGFSDIEDGAVICSNEEDLYIHIANALAGTEYGILIPLLDYEVVARGYKILSKEELGQKRILISDDVEAEPHESTGN